jgi:pre-mRNA-processing factor SLU7
VFAWDAMDKGVDVHFQAEPTKAAVLRKTYAQKKKDHSSKLKQSVLDKYGGMEHLKVITPSFLRIEGEALVSHFIIEFFDKSNSIKFFINPLSEQ